MAAKQNSTRAPARAQSEPTIGDMSDEQFAALEFKAWEHEDGEWKPPSRQEWQQLADTHLVLLRAAWVIMHRSKPELIETVERLESIAGEYDAAALFEDLGRTEEFFFGLHEIVRLAQLRLAVAGTAYSIGREQEHA